MDVYSDISSEHSEAEGKTGAYVGKLLLLTKQQLFSAERGRKLKDTPRHRTLEN